MEISTKNLGQNCMELNCSSSSLPMAFASPRSGSHILLEELVCNYLNALLEYKLNAMRLS